MEFPRGLLIILGLLALGICHDVSYVFRGGAGWWFYLAVLAGRGAAIVGILMRTTLGWRLALGFFGVVIALNAIAVASTGVNTVPAVVGLVIPALCMIYLYSIRGEFN